MWIQLIDNDRIEILLPNSLTKLIDKEKLRQTKAATVLLLFLCRGKNKRNACDEKSKNKSKTNPSYPWPTRPTIPGHQTHTCWDDDSICQPTTFVCFILFVHALSGLRGYTCTFISTNQIVRYVIAPHWTCLLPFLVHQGYLPFSGVVTHWFWLSRGCWHWILRHLGLATLQGPFRRLLPIVQLIIEAPLSCAVATVHTEQKTNFIWSSSDELVNGKTKMITLRSRTHQVRSGERPSFEGI